MNQHKENISRDELYQKVWMEPISVLSISLGVSGSYIARICQELHVPRPGRGYWARLKAGKETVKDSLPPLKPGDPSVWIRTCFGSFHTDIRPVPPQMHTEVPAKRKSVESPALLIEAKEIFAKAKKDYSSVYLCPRHRKIVHLLTSQDHLEKTIMFARKLFSRIGDYGYRVVLSNMENNFSSPRIETDEIIQKTKDNMYRSAPWSPGACTVAYFGTVAIGLIIVEMTELAKKEGWYESTKIATGRYRLYAYSPYRHTELVTWWQDTKDSLLTDRFDEIIIEMEKLAQRIPSLITEGERQAAEKQAKREEEHRAYKKECALKARRETKNESRTELHKLIETWSTMRRQQDFLNELNSMLDGLTPEEKLEIQSRVDIAKNLLTESSLQDLIRTWKTPEERYKALSNWWGDDEE